MALALKLDPINMDLWLIILPTSHISFTSSINMVFYPPKGLLNTMEAMELTKFGTTFFVISIIDLKLIIKLPKYMFVFFSLNNWVKCFFKIHEHLFPPYTTLFWPKHTNSTHDQTYTFFNICLHITTQNDVVNSFTYIYNPNNLFWSHMGFPIIHTFGQNSHNIHFQATNLTNIHNPPNLSQIIIFNWKINISLAWSWNPRLSSCQGHIHTPFNWFKLFIQLHISMFHAKNHNNYINKLKFILSQFKITLLCSSANHNF